MGRRHAAAAIVLFWGLAACDSGLVDSLLPGRDAGPIDEGTPPDVDSELDLGPDVAPAIDATPDRALDATPDAAGDAVPDGRADAVIDGGADAGSDGMADPVDAAPNDAVLMDGPPPDMGLPDLAIDAAPPPPDLGPLCVDDSDCDGVCTDGRCRPCAMGAECAGQRCEDGICLPCEGPDDCDTGLCLDGACQPCGLAEQCAAGQGCVEQRCDDCADDAHCRAGQVCVQGTCGACDPLDHRGCGPDALCCGGACVATDPAVQCAGCGVACDEAASDGCVGRACVCGAGDACDDAAPFCLGEESACVECRDDGDCADGTVCVDSGFCAPSTIIDAMLADADLGVMVDFIRLAQLEESLRERRVVTIFALPDETFAALGPACRVAIGRQALDFVRHHTILGMARFTEALLVDFAEQDPDGAPLGMESRQTALIAVGPDGSVLVDQLHLSHTIEAGNGLIHVLEGGALMTASYQDGCMPAP